MNPDHPRTTVQTAVSMEAGSLPSARPDQRMFPSPFAPRKCTQRHCDHLEKLQPVERSPRERKIESIYVSVFLESISSASTIYGYWEVDAQLFEEPNWTPIVCCDKFELLVQCPPGKRITLGNLDLAVILISCLEDANDGAFIRKLTSTSKCWPTGHVHFRWLLRGPLAEGGPGSDVEDGNWPFTQRSKSLKKLFSPVKHLKLATQSLERKRTMSLEQLQSPTSPTTPSRLQRWESVRRQSLEPSGGICASPTKHSHEGRRSSSWKERTSSLFQSKRQSHHSTSSKSTSSSSGLSRSADTGVFDMGNSQIHEVFPTAMGYL